MKSPYTQEDMILVEDVKTLHKNGITFKITLVYYKCPDTGYMFEDEELADSNYIKMMNEYKKLERNSNK